MSFEQLVTVNQSINDAPSDGTLIKLDNISKSFEVYDKTWHRLLQMLFGSLRDFYRPFVALEDINLTAKKGECIGIIGNNGAGKSTLLQIITGILSFNTGSANTWGRIAALLELGSGFNPEFTGKENVWLNAAILGLSDAEIEERYEDIVAFADIGDVLDMPLRTYSSGMILRLAFGVLAHVNADILIIDEALAVGDAFFRQKCMRFLREFMQSRTVLFVSHDIAAVNSLCTRAMLLQKGRQIMDGNPREITRSYLEKMFRERQTVHNLTQNLPEEQNQQENKQVLSVLDKKLRQMAHSGLGHDARQELLKNSNLRNDLEIFQFDPRTAAFGDGGAIIENVYLADEQGRNLVWAIGGELVRLRIACRAIHNLTSPIVGFYVCNGYGQQLFGDNTWLSYREQPLYVKAKEQFYAEFLFRMPILNVGNYSISVSVASGSQQEHIQHCWLHDALIFVSHTTSIPTGLIGIPIHSIVLELGNGQKS